VTRTRDFDACISAIASADADPTADLNLWLSSGAQHYWNPSQKTPATAWEAEIDGLMEKQMVTRDRQARKRLFDRVQEIAMENVPLIPLATPHLLAGAKKDLANFRPAALDPYTLWNSEELCWRAERQRAGRAR
jgi:peptide/nickel transport system substrate-binding protein